MHDPSHALQKALVARLKSAVPLVASRVFDHAPQSVTFPYIGIGDTQAIEDGAECIDGADVTITIHIWSREVGAVEARKIADQVAAALTDWEPDLSADGFAFASGMVRSSRVMADPDGLTTHGILTFEALTERL